MRILKMMPINEQYHWIAWAKTYLAPIERQITALKDWIQYFDPNWTNSAIQPEELDDSHWIISGGALHYRTSYVVKNDITYLYLGQWNATKDFAEELKQGRLLKLRSGQQVFSVAQPVNNTIQDSSALIRQKATSYMIVPRSDAGYYIPTLKQTENILFTYVKNAVDQYGSKLPLGWHTSPARYFTTQPMLWRRNSSSGYIINNINTTNYVPLIAFETQSGQKQTWTNLFPLQHEILYHNEEVIMDTEANTSLTEVENTLTTRYNIIRPNNQKTTLDFNIVVY